MSSRTIFIIKFIHTLVFLFMAACLLYILYCGLSATFNWLLLIAIGAITIEGVVLILNGWQCPFTLLARRYGVVKAEVTDLFMPEVISRHTFKFSTVLFICEIVLLVVRYVAGL